MAGGKVSALRVGPADPMTKQHFLQISIPMSDHIPSLADLLLPEAQRPTRFVVGNRMFDPQRVGYVSDGEGGPGRFVFDTRLPGNRNTGHLYGVELEAAQREELLEYLKTL